MKRQTLWAGINKIRGGGFQPIAVAVHLTALLKAGIGQQRQYYNIMLCYNRPYSSYWFR